MKFGNDNLQMWSPTFASRGVMMGLLSLALACSEPKSSPNVGSNTNWLTSCDVDGDCSASLGCNCGSCSKGCSSVVDCGDYAGTACVLAAEDAANAQCRGTVSWASQGICLPPCAPGACIADQACFMGSCVPLALPGSDFCSAAANADSEIRAREEDLILAVEQARRAGGIDCGSGSTASQLPFVRIEPRLTCAARVLAGDIAASGVQSLTDSSGRNTTDRYTLAGYQQRYWAEGYAWDVTSASAALQAMLKDAGFCAGFINTTLVDIGAGYSGNIYVVTLATE